ncbi:MFS transporter [Pseudonocardia phyllosphaerae]|uniref:MFS transporter n=1 Tax=Pseudonocardia phyllosphaerae TaxID=3390502 RepID=UPI00397CA4E9
MVSTGADASGPESSPEPMPESATGSQAGPAEGRWAQRLALLRHRDFRYLWLAEILSVAGDQVARVALTVLVLQRTGSIAGSAAVYALTFLPALLGGMFLGHLADRFARRTVMAACDLVRCVLVALMAVPGIPLPVVCALLVVTVLLTGPHGAARSSVLPDILGGNLLPQGIALRQVSAQLAQVVGFACGGVLVAAATPAGALLIDSVTFAVSSLLVAFGVRAAAAVRPAEATGASGAAGPSRSAEDPDAAAADLAVDAGLPTGSDPTGSDPTGPDPTGTDPAGGAPEGKRRALADPRTGLRTVLLHPRRRYTALMSWLIGIYVLPEALAAGYAAQLGADPADTGILMAAGPVGSVVGGALFAFAIPAARRESWMVPLAVGAAVPLTLTPLATGMWAAFALWTVSGACAMASMVQAQTGFIRATPSEVRGRAVGVAASGLMASQGVAILLAGIVAQWSAPAEALAAFGVLGVLLTLMLFTLGRSGRVVADEAAGATG